MTRQNKGSFLAYEKKGLINAQLAKLPINIMTNSEVTMLSEAILKAVSERKAAESAYGKWLTVTEAMRYAEVKSRKTILAWINEGYIYAFRRTGSWIIDRESIDNWYNKDRF